MFNKQSSSHSLTSHICGDQTKVRKIRTYHDYNSTVAYSPSKNMEKMAGEKKKTRRWSGQWRKRKGDEVTSQDSLSLSTVFGKYSTFVTLHAYQRFVNTIPVSQLVLAEDSAGLVQTSSNFLHETPIIYLIYSIVWWNIRASALQAWGVRWTSAVCPLCLRPTDAFANLDGTG